MQPVPPAMAYSSELPAILGSREQVLMVKLKPCALSSAVGQNASSHASLPFFCVCVWCIHRLSQDPMLYPLHRSKCDLYCIFMLHLPKSLAGLRVDMLTRQGIRQRFLFCFTLIHTCAQGVCGMVVVQVSVCGSQEVTFLPSTM